MAKLGILVEHLVDQNDRILEAVSVMRDQVAKIPKIEEDIETIKNDIYAMKVTLKLTNKDVQDHEQRITVLESHA